MILDKGGVQLWNFKKKVLSTLVGLLLIGGGSVSAEALYHLEAQHNYLGVSSDYGNCTYGNRSCPLYCDRLETYLQASGYTKKQKWYDGNAWESDLTSGKDLVDAAHFFVWAGHGADYTYDDGTNGYESAAHFYNLNSNTVYHSPFTHLNPQANATWSEIKWGNKMDYATMYTCNFLHDGGNSTNLTKIKNMFTGLHLMVGFASKMYIHPDEAWTYGEMLQQGYPIKIAWQYGNLLYQPYIGEETTVISAWVYHKDHEDDTLSIHADPPSIYFEPQNYFKSYNVVN